MCGRDELPNDKVSIDLAFAGAWREWPYSNRFPQVSTDLRNGLDPMHVLTRAGSSKNDWNLYWEKSAKIVIRRRDQWEDRGIDVDAIADSIDGDVPAAGWRTLAEFFLARLDR